MDRQELQRQMKFHLEEYTSLKTKLELLNKTDKISRLRQSQSSLLEEFKSRYTVQISSSGEISGMTYEDLKELILSEENLHSISSIQEGHMLGYTKNGMPAYVNQYKNGSVFITLAVDQRDAELFLEREKRRIESQHKESIYS